MPGPTAGPDAPEPPGEATNGATNMPTKAPTEEPPAGATVRALVRRAGQATLATHLAPGSDAPDSGAPEAPSRGAGIWPYASLVLAAADHDGSPLLLLSDLADHSRNLAARPEAALLFDGTGGRRDPLTGPRATLLGRVTPLTAGARVARLTARFVARHPGAERYAGFTDFRLYRMTVVGAHLVAGFGRIHWLPAAEVLFDTADCGALAAAEAEIVAHMNVDHRDALAAMAAMAAAAPGGPSAAGSEPWLMTGLDPEGLDLRRGAARLRVDFDRPVGDAAAARAALIAAARRARAGAAGDG
jgi:putative heme iron utilization protein